jgi:predicted ATPase/class 3 adenylate cyclase
MKVLEILDHEAKGGHASDVRARAQLIFDSRLQCVGLPMLRSLMTAHSVSEVRDAIPALVPRAFLFTDVEGSSQLMERAESACKEALEFHDRLLRDVAASHGGVELSEAGDGFLFAFHDVKAAAEAALDLQGKIEATAWPVEVRSLRVRAALGWGEVTPLHRGEYRGLVLNRTARLLGAASGGQTVCGKMFAMALGDSPALHELGWFHLRDLAEPEQVFQIQEPGTSRQRFQPLNLQPVVPSNLPRSFTTFFGREDEITRISNALRSSPASRLITLSGPGGTGKTRLSLAVAERLRAHYSEAVWFVPLADLLEPPLIPLTLRDSLRLPQDSHDDPFVQVTQFLAARPCLLVLDNFEQLLPDGADTIHRLVRDTPELRMIVSSRNRLGLPEEHEFPIQPLETPRIEDDTETNTIAKFSSVQLFADRAAVARPSFELTAENASPVAKVCRVLEGVPLAIELAASRADVIAPAEMLAELDERLNFCVSNLPDLPARHRSLRAAIDWSYNFLPPALQLYFERLSVFRGGWTADAAAAVAHDAAVSMQAGETRRALAELRGASLVRAEEVNGAMRFHMLETIRQYAAEKLAARHEAKEISSRHAEFFAQLAERAEAEFHTERAEHWISRLDLERQNLRAALATAAEETSDPSTLARIATALAPYWIGRGLASEGRRWLDQCAAHCELLPPKSRASVLYCAGTLAVQQRDWEIARTSFLGALDEFRALGDELNVAALLSNLGIVAATSGNLQEAKRWLAESLKLYARLDHPTREALALVNLGTVHIDLDDLPSASVAYGRALKLSEMTGDLGTNALACHGLAQIELHSRQFEKAGAAAEESLTLNRRLKLQPRLAQDALLLACIGAARNDMEKSAEWLGAADWLTRDTDALASVRLAQIVEGIRIRLRAELSPAVLAQRTATGRRTARAWCEDAPIERTRFPSTA